MSSIDERVVEMQFDNQQFESGIKESTSSLDRLKESLNLDGASKGLDNVSKAVSDFTMDGVTTAVETSKNSFSALETVATAALVRITDQAMQAGEQLLQSLSVDQISEGYDKYTAKLSNVQTIMNATGDDIDTVNGYMDHLMWYSDETSYGFTDMTTALANMVSTGGDIETLIPMIEGVANATAYAGQNAEAFTHVISAVNSAYSRGYMMATDWNRIAYQSAGSKQLQEEFIAVGESLGKIEEGTVTLENFRNSLANGDTKGWLDTEVMEEAFNTFSEMTEAAYELIEAGEYETATEAYQALSDQYGEVAVAAALAAQQAKTFGEAIDATKDAVSSKWSVIMQSIFGDYEEATQLWTDLSEELYDLFAEPLSDLGDKVSEAFGTTGSSAFDKVSEQVEETGVSMEHFTSTLENVMGEAGFEGLIEETGSVSAAFDQLDVDERTQVISDALDALCENSDAASMSMSDLGDVVTRVVRGDFGNGEERYRALAEAGYDYELVQAAVNECWDGASLHLENLSDAELEAMGYSEETIAELRALQESMGDTGSEFNQAIASMDSGLTGFQALWGGLANIGKTIESLGSTIAAAWSDVFPETTADDIRSALQSFYNTTQKIFLKVEEAALKLQSVFRGLFSVIDMGKDIVVSLAKGAFSLLKDALGNCNIDILSIVGAIGDLVYAFHNWFTENEIAEKAVNGLIGIIKALWNGLVSLKDSFLNLPIVQSALTSLSNVGTKALNALNKAFPATTSWVKALITSFNETGEINFSFLNEAFKSLGKELGDLVSGAFPRTSKAITNFIKKTNGDFSQLNLQAVIKLLKKFKKDFVNLILDIVDNSEFLSGIRDKIDSFIETFKELTGIDLSWDGITKAFSNLKESIEEFAQTHFGDTYKAVDDFINGLIEDFGNFSFDDVINIIKTFKNDLVKAFNDLIDENEFLSGIRNKITSIVNKIKEFFNVDFSGVGDAFSNLKSTISTAITDILKAFGLIKDESEDGLEETAEEVTSPLEVIKTAFNNVKESLENFGSSIGKVISSIFTSLINGLKSLKDKLVKAVDEFIDGNEFLSGLRDKVNSFVEWIKKIFNIDFSSVGETFSSLKDTIGDAITSILKSLGLMKDDSVSDAEGTAEGLKSPLETISEAFSNIKESLGNFASSVGEALSSINVGTILGIAAAFGVLFTVFKTLGSLFNISNSVTTITKAFRDITKSYKMNSFGSSSIKIAVAIGILTAALVSLAQLPLDKLLESAGVLIVVAGALTALSKVSGNGLGNLGTFAGVAIALLAVVGAFEILGDVQIDSSLITKIGLIAGAIVGLTVAVKSINKIGGTLKGGVGNMAELLGLAVSLKLVISSLKDVSEIDYTAGDVLALIGVFSALVVAMKVLSGVTGGWATIGSAATLVAIPLALKMMMSALDKVADYDTKKILDSIENFVIILGELAGLAVVSRISGSGGGVSMLAMAASVVVMAGAISMLGNLDENSLENGLAAIEMLSLTMGVIASLFALINKIPGGSSGALSIVSMAAAIAVMAVSVGALSTIDPNSLKNATTAIMELGTIFSLMEGFSALTKLSSTSGILSLVAAIGVISVAIGGLSTLDPNNVSVAADAIAQLGLVFSAMEGLSALTKFSDFSSILSLAAVVGVIGVVLGLLANLTDPNDVSIIADALTECMLAFSVALAACAAAGAIASAASVGLTALLPVIGIVTTVIVLIIALCGILNETKAGDFVIGAMEYLGELIGAVIGGIAGQAIASAASILADASEDLASMSASLTLLGGIIEEMSSSFGEIDDSLLDKIKSLSSICLALSEADFLSTISNLISGKKTYEQLGEGLTAIADSMTEFGDAAANISEDDFKRGVKALEALTDAQESLQSVGGLVDVFTGVKEWSSLSEGLDTLGTTIKSFSDSMNGVVIDETSISAITDLADAQQSIEAVGGIADIMGKHSWSTLSTDLDTMAEALCDFSSTVGDGSINADNIGVAIKALKLLAKAQGEIEGAGGVVQAIVGETDWATLSHGLTKMGNALVNFSEAINENGGLNKDNMDAAIDMLASLAEAQGKIEGAGGVLQVLVGNTNWSTLSAGLKDMGDALSDFSMSITNGNGIDSKAIGNAIDAISLLADAQDDIGKSGGFLQGVFGDKSWSSLSDNLVDLGTGLVGLSSAGGQISLEAVTKSCEAIKAVGELGDIIFASGENYEWIIDHLSDIGIAISDFGGKITGVTWPDNLDQLGVILTTIGDSVKTVASIKDKNLNKMATILDEIGPALHDFIDGDNGIGNLTWPDMSSLVEMISGIVEATSELDYVVDTGKLGDVLNDVGDAVVDFATKMQDFTVPDLSDLETMIDTIASATVSVQSINSEQLSTILTNTKKALKGFKDISLPNNADDIASVIQSIGDACVAANDIDVDSLSTMYTSISDAIVAFDELDFSNISSSAEALQLACNNFKDLEYPDITEDVNSFIESIDTNSWPTDYPNIDSSVKSLQSGIDEFGSIKFPSTETLDNFAIELSTALDGAGDAGAQAMIDRLLSYEPNVNSAGVTLIAALSDGMNNSVALVTTACDGICQSALAIIISYQGAFQSQGSTLIQMLANGMSQNAEAVYSIVRNIFDSVVTIANSYNNSMYDVGLNMAQGYANGIADGTNSAINAATNMVVQAINAANSAQDSHSPSKVTERSGKWFDQGYANGISKFIPLIKAAAEDAADTAIDSLSDEMSGIPTEMDLNPTITPVLDLSQIRSGAAAMYGMLSGGSSLSVDVGRANRTFGSVSEFQNGQRNPNADILRAIEGLNEGISERRGNTYNINGVTYDDGSNVSSAIEQLFRALRLEGRA